MIKTNSQSIVRTCVTWGYVDLCHSCDYPMTLPWHSYYHHMVMHDKAITAIWSSRDHHMTVPRGLHGHQWLTVWLTVMWPSQDHHIHFPAGDPPEDNAHWILAATLQYSIHHTDNILHTNMAGIGGRPATVSLCCHGNKTSCANFMMASQVWGLVL